jgi:hypothetical protein
MKYFFIIVAFIALLFQSCSGGTAKQTTKSSIVDAAVIVPIFNADSAYNFVEKQVAFGPRVPNSDAHRACADYLAGKFKEYGAEVVVQEAKLTAYTGTQLDARNIIAQFQPEKKKRVLLCAHWDSRPWADADPDPSNHRKPILGANDGGSGVGVLLEVARHLAATPTEIGVDIILFDAEDYGTHASEISTIENSWALGSQYWARIPHKANYNARYGILLDIVGAADACFYREGISEHFASNIIDKVWNYASKLGYSDTFINEEGGYVTDDHLYINQFLGIPCIDIISHKKEDGSFGPYWHTIKDDMEWISAETLKKVGQTVLTVIYNEK